MEGQKPGEQATFGRGLIAAFSQIVPGGRYPNRYYHNFQLTEEGLKQAAAREKVSGKAST
jgi:hypothetical protein